MMIRKQLREWITGLTTPQEYICTAYEDFTDRLTVTLSYPGITEFTDVTASHIFLGYQPLIIALPENISSTGKLHEQTSIVLAFHRNNFQANASWRGFEIDKQSLATLKLEKIDHEEILGDTRILFYHGSTGAHVFLSSFHQFMNRQLEKTRVKAVGNISLPGNLVDQVRIAYSIPRIVSIISVMHEEKVNLFPTDLHGPVDKDFYVSSLRQGGKASKQVESTKRIVVAEVDVSQYKEVYALGKNHMKDFSSRSDFNLLSEGSKTFEYVLPMGTIQYRELMLLNSFNYGIHRIHMYSVVGRERLCENHMLAHIHQYYAQWRIDNGVNTTLYFR